MSEMDHNLFHSDLEFQFPIHLTLIDRLKIAIDNAREMNVPEPSENREWENDVHLIALKSISFRSFM